jgi:hypothetical protein
MENDIVFVDRRRKQDRRLDEDPCKDIPVDLYHRMRRKTTDRRKMDKSLVEDYFDFLEAHSQRTFHNVPDAKLN